MRRAVTNCMLIIVMAKPMLLTMVSDEPFVSAEAFWAISVENSGESAITAMLQIKRKAIKTHIALANKNKGEAIQHIQEINKAIVATLLAPNLCDK